MGETDAPDEDAEASDADVLDPDLARDRGRHFDRIFGGKSV